MKTGFVKMHGCGNDFVVLDERAAPLGLDPAASRRHRRPAHRHRLRPAHHHRTAAGHGADAFMRIRNPDGTEAGACGNATRCVAAPAAARPAAAQSLIRTIAGDLPAACRGRAASSRSTWAPPRLDWRDIPLARPCRHAAPDLAGPLRDPAAVSMGNPHATFFVADSRRCRSRPSARGWNTTRYFPERANIGFAQVLAPDRIRLRVWERGAGLTLACGSGACAALVNAAPPRPTGRARHWCRDGGDPGHRVARRRPRADDRPGRHRLPPAGRPRGLPT